MKYRARHTKKSTINHFKKSAALLIAMVLIVTLGVGSTLAYLIDTSSEVTNTFLPSEVTCEVHETFDGTKKSNVYIQNVKDDDGLSDTEAYIRAAIVGTWKDAVGGNVYGQKPVAGTDYTITLTNTTQKADAWVKGADGYYYWTSPVPVGEFTGVLITSCTPVDGKEPDGYHLSVEIIAEAIQSEPSTAVTSSWTSGVSSVNGTTLVIK